MSRFENIFVTTLGQCKSVQLPTVVTDGFMELYLILPKTLFAFSKNISIKFSDSLAIL